MKECACRLRGGSNGGGTAKFYWLSDLWRHGVQWSQSVSQVLLPGFSQQKDMFTHLSHHSRRLFKTQHVEAASSPRRRTLGRRSVAAPAGEHAQHALRCGGSSS